MDTKPKGGWRRGEDRMGTQYHASEVHPVLNHTQNIESPTQGVLTRYEFFGRFYWLKA